MGKKLMKLYLYIVKGGSITPLMISRKSLMSQFLDKDNVREVEVETKMEDNLDSFVLLIQRKNSEKPVYTFHSDNVAPLLKIYEENKEKYERSVCYYNFYTTNSGNELEEIPTKGNWSDQELEELWWDSYPVLAFDNGQESDNVLTVWEHWIKKDMIL